jgi:hypothetical protein
MSEGDHSKRSAYALICVVSIIMIAGVFVRNAVGHTADWAIHDPSGDRIGMAKINEPFIPKSVQVFNASPNKPIFVATVTARGNGVCSSSKYARDRDDAGIFQQVTVVEFGRFPSAVSSCRQLYDPSKISSGQSSFIFKTDLPDQLPSGHSVNAFRHSSNVGALEDAGFLRLAAASPPSNNPKPDSGNGQNASKSNKPQGEIRGWVAASLFPEPVIFAFLGGALIGCGIVAAVAGHGVKKWKDDINPKHKKEYSADK